MDPPPRAIPKIAVIPGGAYCDINTKRIFAQLEKDTGKRITDLFSGLWGLSIGAFDVALLAATDITAEDLLSLHRDIFAHIPSALGIRGILRKMLGSDPLLCDTRIPVSILCSKVTEWKFNYPTKTEIVCFNSQDDPDAYLSDVACASCTVFPLHPFTQPIRIAGSEEACSYFMDSGSIASSSSCMNPLRRCLAKSKHEKMDIYFFGNGWVNQPSFDDDRVRDFYSVTIDFDKVFADWKQETKMGGCCNWLTNRDALCNVAGAGLIPTEIMERAANEYLLSDAYKELRDALVSPDPRQ